MYNFNEIESISKISIELYTILRPILSLEDWNNDIYAEYFGEGFKELGDDYKCSKIDINEEKDEISSTNSDMSKNLELSLIHI